MIERRPRAPVLRSMALRAIAPRASSASVRSIDSISNSRWYCFTSAFLGWVRMSLRVGSSRSSSVATTGSRPTNSGIRPYFNRSAGSTSRKISLEQRLLHALARDVAGDRGVVGLAADLVDLVDIDDTALGALDIVIGRLQQLEDDVLDVLTDIAGFGESGRVSHGEGHVEDARQRLRQQRLAGTGGTDQQDVGLGELDVVVLGLVVETLVVIMDCDREHLLGVILTDDIVVKNFAYLLGGGNAVARLR